MRASQIWVEHLQELVQFSEFVNCTSRSYLWKNWTALANEDALLTLRGGRTRTTR